MPTTMTSILFCALVLGVSAMLALGLTSGLGRTPRAHVLGGGAVIAWLALTYTLADDGVFHDFDAAPPPLMRFMGASVVLAIVLVTSGLGRRLALGVPLFALIGMQVFRLPVELVLHRFYVEGVLPVQMTYLGRNFDVITALIALPVAYVAYRRGEHDALARRLALGFNVVGLGLLLNIVVIATISAPGPLRVFMNEPANVIVSRAPFIWLPSVLVMTALLGHLFTFRRLLALRAMAPTTVVPAPPARSIA